MINLYFKLHKNIFFEIFSAGQTVDNFSRSGPRPAIRVQNFDPSNGKIRSLEKACKNETIGTTKTNVIKRRFIITYLKFIPHALPACSTKLVID